MTALVQLVSRAQELVLTGSQQGELVAETYFQMCL